MAKYKITKQQLVELKEKMINLPPLVKKALVGEPINTPDEAQQGVLIYETPDGIINNNRHIHWSDDDAIAFGFEHGKAYVGYNNEMFFDAITVGDDFKDRIDKIKWQDVERMMMHAGIADFYTFLYGEKHTNNLMSDRSGFGYHGRLWVNKEIISFWEYPSKEKLPQLIKMLQDEINNIYGININFSTFQIEIKQNEYVADLDTDDEDYEPDIDWEQSQKNGTLIPIKDFISSNDATEREMQAIHLLPSDEKMKTPQMQAARDVDAERLGRKFNGNVSQAEWNNARKKYQGESKRIKITTSQLNEIKEYLLNEDITIPVTAGDTVMMGKFKNKKTVVKTIDKDSHGMPTINGKQATTFRTVKEDKDYLSVKYNGEHINLSNEDIEAMPFVYYHNKVYVGYTPYLGGSYVDAGYEDSNYETNYPNYHEDIPDFYRFINKDNENYHIDLPMYRNDFTYIGRVWLDHDVVSFYKYPEDKSKMKQIMGLLSDEIYEVYGERFIFNKTLVNILDEYGKERLIPMNEYVGSDNVSDDKMETPHLLPPDKKMNNQQFKSSLDAKYAHIGNKLGSMTQAEYNHYKRYGMGESVIKEEQKNDLLLYHGTKHNFLKFETTNIGGGEGNQSFGWGIYFTDNKSVSEFYANLLGGDNGLVYTINISNGNFMSWYGKLEKDFCDKLASNMIQNGITELPINRMLNNGKVEVNKLPTKEAIAYYPNGKFLYENLALALGGDKMTSNKLNELGVDGVYYPIGQFLKKGDKSHANGTNYVLFSEDKINIIKKENINVNMVTEATESDVNLSSFKPKKELNEKFWVNNKLKPIVRKRLLKIADDFIDFLKIDIKKVEDVLFLGSLANYNWSSYSDVDLHLLVDFKTINKDVELVRDYFDSKRNLWNDEHDNLKIFGFPIEVYVQDKNDENASVGVFSLEKNKWLTKPEVIDDKDFDKKKIKEKASVIMTDIDDLLSKYKKKPSFNELNTISTKVKKLYDKIKKMRKVGLASEKGETSVGNIVFKVLRRNGYMEKLVDLKTLTYDKINSIK